MKLIKKKINQLKNALEIRNLNYLIFIYALIKFHFNRFFSQPFSFKSCCLINGSHKNEVTKNFQIKMMKLLLFLVICCISNSAKSSKFLRSLKHYRNSLEVFSVLQMKSMSSDVLTAMQMTSITKACLSEIIKAAPPYYCWKSPGDAGIMPTNCPSGYFRVLALCYQMCQSSQFLSVLLGCPSLTNFDSRVTCDSGYYKSLALCYRDCGKIFLKNCGIGACAASDFACATVILEIANAFAAIVQTVQLALSFNAAYKTYLAQMQSKFTVVSTSVINDAYENYGNYLTRTYVETLINYCFPHLIQSAIECFKV